MKKTPPTRSKSVSSAPKNVAQSKTRPKVSKRATVPSIPPQAKTRLSREQRKQQIQKEEQINEKVIDLSKQEDAEELVAKLVTLLNIQLPHDYTGADSMLYTRHGVDNYSPLHSKTHGDQFYTRLKNTKKNQQLVSFKLPSVDREERSLFRISYSQPTNYQSLQNKLQKFSPRPYSRAIFDDRGMTFSGMKARDSRESQKSMSKNNCHPRSRTFPGLARDNETSRKSKTGRYSVTFVGDFPGKTNEQAVLV